MKLKLYFIFLFLVSQTFLSQNNYYWVGGTGSWSDLNHWRIGSVSGQTATIIPSRYDNVYITSGSGFTSAGGLLTIPSSATCKDFIIDDSFTGKLAFPSDSVFNIYGNLKWKSNAGVYYNVTMNLYSDSSNQTPNLIDIQDNLISPGFIGTSYISSFNLKGNGTFKLVKNFTSNGLFQFNINDSALLDTDHKNITAQNLTHISTAASRFGTSTLTATNAMQFNSTANLTQATLSFSSLTIQTTQDIKKITLPTGAYYQISAGNSLKVDELTGIGTGSSTITGNELNINKIDLYGLNITANVLQANDVVLGDGSCDFSGKRYEIKNLSLGRGNVVLRAQQFDINNLVLNGGLYTFRQNQSLTPNYFQVTQTMIANSSCNGNIPRFGGVDNTTPVNMILPSSINGNGTASLSDYNLIAVKLTGGGSMTAGMDGGNNTGNITYSGIPSKTLYWIGGGGSWNDPSHWAFTSGGAAANCIPHMYDDVVFNASSGFTSGNNTITATGPVFVHNMTWNNAPATPVYNPVTYVYGNVYLQKDMSASASKFNIFKYNNTGPAANRYMNFEGQKIAQLNVSGNDNFYLMAATISSLYDVEVAANFNFDNNAIVSNLYADGRKIKAREFWLGGNTISIDNAILQMTTLNINTRQTITAPNTSVYIQNYNGKYYYSGNGNHYFGKIFKEGPFQGDFRSVNTGILQVNAGDIRFLDANKTDHFIINSSSHIMMNDSSTQLMVNKTFVYNRNDCDLAVNFTGSGGNNLVLGNVINGNGFVELNRMNISGINATYINPVQGAKPVNAGNSTDGGNNSGINFTAANVKNFYWKGGSGNWTDITHWSLDSTSSRVTSTCGIPTSNDNVFFDQNSGFMTNGITAIQLSGDVTVNDITFSGLPASSRSYFGGTNNYYKMNVNGNMVLHPGYYDAGYFSGFTFINTNKPSDIIKSLTPNGASSVLTFSGNARWKINRGTSAYDLDGNSHIIQNNIPGNVLDMSGTLLKLVTLNVNGDQLLMNNADITINSTFMVNTAKPVVNTANSVIKIIKASGSIANEITSNNLSHYFEKIEFTNTTGSNDYVMNFNLTGGIINNFIVHSASGSRLDKVNPSLTIKSPLTVNHLTIEKNNHIALEANLQVNQSLLMLGDCVDKLIFSSNSLQPRSLILPDYTSNPSGYSMDRVQFKMISSSGGQTYLTTKSTDLGGNTGINFQDAIPANARNLYWVGGQGEWRDPLHWSLTSGGAPITGCDIPNGADNVFFDQNSGFTAGQSKIIIKGSNLSKANKITFNNAINQPILDFGASTNAMYYLNVYGNLVLQNDLKINVPVSPYGLHRNIILSQGTVSGKTRYIDTRGAYIYLNINAQDYFELKSPYLGDINFNNVAGFKTNSQPMTLVNFSWNQTTSNNPVVDFGQSVVNGTRVNSAGTPNFYMASLPAYNFYSPYFSINSGNNPVTLKLSETKIETGYFVTNTPEASILGDLTIWKDGNLNTGTKIWDFSKMTFLGSSSVNSVSTLSSSGKYKTLYFNPGSYQVNSHQTVTENLFMTGTPCNRISVLRSTTGQNMINLDPAAKYTMFYASIKDMNFSRPVNAYGNSQDLGNTANLNIIPTDVQAAGFGGNKTLCASEFPKTYDASTLFGTDPNASYTWTKINSLNSVVIGNSSSISFAQPGNYRVNVTYGQDGCNITEDFSISSVTLPVDSTISSSTSTIRQTTGDVQVKFKGSLAQPYIFTYTLNGGPDQTITSASNGEAIILHPGNQVGTFVYRLKGMRFANGQACPIDLNNKEIVINVNPECPTPGVMMLMNGILRGCTASAGARRITELLPSTIANPPTDNGLNRFISGTGIVVREGNDVFMIRNTNASPETLTLPASKPHVVGAVIYHNDHFYEGTDNGKWIRVDND
ncbi:hypothetical protein H3Z85_16850 [Chryseobacterium indologenes]|uniref:hypothetical protein n=1 Tax=Chryseobacterium indologenes TaxID=253 RepID=UPI0003E06165|nr:hypothetical protein [Chryseobacterium indologenes]QPQ51011.1 hypothetical protein H3Z85_16850 [Chryseobacterium indologenes]GAE65832.1 hypothetical protein CIN01S_12_02040 [Chryseobacterium indologenes NBRC 14944]SFK06666.1 hypothetical protein SAMN05421692_3337 [Chryseobacterium indologenes]SUX49364.1 Uncharacterised protein [Chryseobacterium indologenes]